MRFGGNGFDYLLGSVVARTRKAMLFQSDFMDEPIWLPHSQCTYRAESVECEFVTSPGLELLPNDMGELRVEVRVADWLINKNGYK